MLNYCENVFRTNSQIETSVIKNFDKKQKLTLISLALVDFMSFCSMSIMAPFFPKEATEKGLSDTMTGFVFSFYALIMFLTSPIFGKVVSNSQFLQKEKFLNFFTSRSYLNWVQNFYLLPEFLSQAFVICYLGNYFQNKNH